MEALLTEQGMAVQHTGPIPLSGSGRPFGPPEDLLEEAKSKKPGEALSKPYESHGMYWVAALTSREEPDAGDFETGKAKIEETLLADRREELFGRWVDSLVAKAKVQ